MITTITPYLKLEVDADCLPDNLPVYIAELNNTELYSAAEPARKFLLRLKSDGLSLESCESDPGKLDAAPTRVDFLSPSLLHRLKTSGKKQGIGQAIGLNRHDSVDVLDVTAGLGRDSFILAALGCTVRMLERSPVVHALLADGISRAIASDHPEVLNAMSRMSLHRADAFSWMEEIIEGKADKVDVVYLDPMYPVKEKSASVKKDIALLQGLLGEDQDYEALLEKARLCARRRVVLKRPGKKYTGHGRKPDFQIEGKSSHFEIHLPH